MRYPDAMRVIYTTPRLENAERVAEMMAKEGIGVRLLYGPHFRRPTWRGANYRQTDNPGHWPRVLVLNNGDLPRARGVLRSAGLLASAGYDRGEGEAANLRFRPKPAAADAGRIALRIRAALIAILFLVILVQGFRFIL